MCLPRAGTAVLFTCPAYGLHDNAMWESQDASYGLFRLYPQGISLVHPPKTSDPAVAILEGK